MFRIINMTLESKVKIKYIKSVCMASNVNYFSFFGWRVFIYGTLIAYGV